MSRTALDMSSSSILLVQNRQMSSIRATREIAADMHSAFDCWISVLKYTLLLTLLYWSISWINLLPVPIISSEPVVCQPVCAQRFTAMMDSLLFWHARAANCCV
jgi:hypothetical protein